MSHEYTFDDLDAVAAGDVDDERASAIEAHAADCTECGDELAWLRVEYAAFADRADDQDDDVAGLWQGVADQVDAAAAAPVATPTGSGRVLWFGSGFVVAAAAAAAFIMATRPGTSQQQAPQQTVAVSPSAADTGDKPDPAAVAVAEAEAAYGKAIETLEAVYATKRNQLRDKVASAHDVTFARNRALVAEARAEAGNDIEARVLALDAYARHMHAIKDVVETLE